MAIRRLTYLLVLITASVFLSIPSRAQAIIYVNHAATGADNGSSWTDAHTFLQDALQAAQSGDEVWVAAGTYKPDQGTGITRGDREASFYIPGGVSLYGGFSGTELAREERDWKVNETILSGDLVGNDDEVVSLTNPLRLDNSFHIVRIRHQVDPVVLDGLTISDGTANESLGGNGVSSAIDIYNPNHPDPAYFVRISNCLIQHNATRNRTVSISVSPRTEEPTVILEDSIVRNNFGLSTAGIVATIGTTLVRNVRFEENKGGLTAIGGEVYYIIDSTILNNTGQQQVALGSLGDPETARPYYMWNTTIIGNTSDWATVYQVGGRFLSINNIFHGNITDGGASAILNYDGKATIVNNVFAFNTALRNGGVFLTMDSNTTVVNSIFWENELPEGIEFKSWEPELDRVSISHSLIQQPVPSYVTDNGGIITGNPLFADADGPDNIPGTIDDDFRLTNLSSAIDAGMNDSLSADFLDLDEDGDIVELWPTDFLTNMRIFDGGSGTATVDMGAFEYDAPPVFTAIQKLVDLPNSPRLQGNYPNPFNPSTTISYTLPRPGDVRLEVFDLLGKRVWVLDSGFKPSGAHEVAFDATGFSTGIYFYTLTAGGFTQTRKMVVVK